MQPSDWIQIVALLAVLIMAGLGAWWATYTWLARADVKIDESSRERDKEIHQRIDAVMKDLNETRRDAVGFHEIKQFHEEVGRIHTRIDQLFELLSGRNNGAGK